MIESFLMNLSEVHRLLTYFAIFLGMFIEGELILILAGVLVKAGTITFYKALMVSFGGVVLHDVIWWFVGTRLFKTEKKKFLFLNVEKIKGVLEKVGQKNGFYIFISKFAWSFNRLFLISSGYFKMSFSRLAKYSVSAAFIWSFVYISLGYFFADQTALLKKDVKLFSVLIGALLIGIIAIETGLRFLLKRKRF